MNLYSMLRTSEEFFTTEQDFTLGQTLEEQLLESTGLNKLSRLLVGGV